MDESAAAKCFPAGWSLAAKPCDSCESAAALLFCRTHSAFLCMGCDTKTHANRLGPRHERVWMCEVCEQAPASVTCKADAAALCVTCDRDIHSANPLARRHERCPVVPFYDDAESIVKSTTAATFLVPAATDDDANTDNDSKKFDCVTHKTEVTTETEEPTVPWMILSNPMISSKLPADAPDMKSIEFLFSDSDHFLDFDYPISLQQQEGTDSIVPVQTIKPPVPPQLLDHSQGSPFEIDFTRSNLCSYNNSCGAQSLSQSISSSDVGVVPDGSSVSDISYPFGRTMNNSMDLSASTNANQSSQLLGMDREARVLRYREKRKNRKFEKTIRYASRKAYAETRPRIKGRFAKRTENDAEGDRMFTPGSTPFMADVRYGVVPTL